MEVRPIFREFIGKDKKYAIEAYKDTSLTGHFKDSLMIAVIGLQEKVHKNRDPELVTYRVQHSFELPNLGVATVKEGGVEGRVIAYTVFSSINLEFRQSEPAYFLQTPRKQVLNCTRGVLPGFERKGLGSEMLRIGIRELYPHSDFLLFMTQNPSSVLSTWKINEIENPYPFGRELDIDQPLCTYEQDRELQWFLIAGYNLYRYDDSTSLDIVTGRSTGDLMTIGSNYRGFIKDKKNYWEWVIYRKMVLPFPRGIDMNRERGDEAWVMSRINTTLPGTTGKIPSVG